MPESPEVSRSRDKLRWILIEPRSIVEGSGSALGPANGFFHTPGCRYAKKAPKGFVELSAQGSVDVVSIDAKGKFMYWQLKTGSGETWWMHCTYGMAGGWKRPLESELPWKGAKHTALNFRYSRNSDDWHIDGRLAFVDPRRFGTIKFTNDKREHERKLASLGPDMLNDPPDREEFAKRLRKRGAKPIGEALVDQRIVSGIGNYLRAEILYLAEVSPWRLVSSLTDNELERIRVQSTNVMKASYALGGATIKTYTDVDNVEGDSQKHLLVYGKKADPMGNPVTREEMGKRTIWWVPNVQH